MKKLMADRSLWLGLAAAGAVLLIFVADLRTPLGFAHGMLYIPCLLLAFYSAQRQWLMWLGWLAALLTVAGLLLARPMFVGVDIPWVLANRLLTVWMIMTVTWLLLQLHVHMERLQRTLQRGKDARLQLQEQQHFLDIAARVMRLGGWVIHLPEYRLNYSIAAMDLHGLPAEQSLTLQQAISAYHPESQSVLHEALIACAEQGLPIDHELRLADGHTWLRVTAEAVYGSDGHITHIQGAVQDITPAKQNETLLQGSRARFEHLARVLPLTVWTAEPDGTVDYVNVYLSEYCDVPLAEILQPGGWLLLLHPDDREPCVEYWMHCVAQSIPYQLECRVRRGDGVYRLHRVQAEPVADASGTVGKWYGTALEIPLEL